MANIALAARDCCKTFSRDNEQYQVLKNLNLDIYEGDFTVIMGPSGAGKSTLLNILSGMDIPSSGEISFSGNDIGKLSSDKLAVFRRDNCGFVFQKMHLLDNMSVLDNVIVCGLLIGKKRKDVADNAKKLLGKLNINDTIWSKYPSQISGGEAQRACIARALINNPRILFADEPTGALNSAYGKAVLDELTDVNEQGRSIVMATHDIRSARRGNRILYLRDGVICDECDLGKNISDDTERQNKLRDFLQEMGW